jgi:hypothetical protein
VGVKSERMNRVSSAPSTPRFTSYITPRFTGCLLVVPLPLDGRFEHTPLAS